MRADHVDVADHLVVIVAVTVVWLARHADRRDETCLQLLIQIWLIDETFKRAPLAARWDATHKEGTVIAAVRREVACNVQRRYELPMSDIAIRVHVWHMGDHQMSSLDDSDLVTVVAELLGVLVADTAHDQPGGDGEVSRRGRRTR